MKLVKGWTRVRCVSPEVDCARMEIYFCPQIDRLLKGPFTDRQGNFNYREWVKVLRVNAETEDTD